MEKKVENLSQSGAKVQIMGAGGPSKAFWQDWGWKVILFEKGRTVLQGTYKLSDGREVAGQIEVIDQPICTVNRVLRFMALLDGKWHHLCLSAQDVCQGIQSAQKILEKIIKPHPHPAPSMPKEGGQ
jgi:hypothetical protein